MPWYYNHDSDLSEVMNLSELVTFCRSWQSTTCKCYHKTPPRGRTQLSARDVQMCTYQSVVSPQFREHVRMVVSVINVCPEIEPQMCCSGCTRKLHRIKKVYAKYNNLLAWYYVRNVGFIFEEYLTLSDQISFKSYYYHLYWRLWTQATASMSTSLWRTLNHLNHLIFAILINSRQTSGFSMIKSLSNLTTTICTEGYGRRLLPLCPHLYEEH